MKDDLDSVALETLALLEWRLRRLEFILTGNEDYEEQEQKTKGTIVERLHALESTFASLASKSKIMSEVQTLQSRLPDLFQSAKPPLDAPSQPPASSFNPAQLLATVLASAPTFQSTASQLAALRDLSLPPTPVFASLASQQPRLAAAADRQLQQSKEISDLRKRSALAVMRWHEVMVLGQGRCWAEWDGRLKAAEREVRREEVRREKEKE
ncbi:hypothetical protein BDY21DRAFT_374372 [Lineolata rhizophorae]|uniref:Nuclear distribution protein RO10 n=1 Tax=Lineolata rhizophorae TaxID=578093 RepID=A0A6A6NR25_9PEZI|nr:hypothetical protein BDY21DRAFT_374372 [Lineolata rhizophorae]